MPAGGYFVFVLDLREISEDLSDFASSRPVLFLPSPGYGHENIKDIFTVY